MSDERVEHLASGPSRCAYIWGAKKECKLVLADGTPSGIKGRHFCRARPLHTDLHACTDCAATARNTPWSQAVAFTERHFSGWRERPLVYMTNALAGELGELCNEVKKLVGGGLGATGSTRDRMVEEIVDLWLYEVVTLEMLGVTDEEFKAAILAKIAKNEARVLAREGA